MSSLDRRARDGLVAERRLSILQVNTFDTLGGAAKVAWNLLQAYRERGHRASLAVGERLSDDPDVYVIPTRDLHGAWTAFWKGAHRRLQSPANASRGASLLGGLALAVAEPKRALDIRLGREDFNFPATWQILDLPRERPDVVHCHNLHGGYFDLRVLPWLSRQAPLVVTMHDAWLLNGGCAHSLDAGQRPVGGHGPCQLEEQGGGRSATARNLRRKSAIYRQSHLFLATPCRWLMGMVERSVLVPAVVEARVIPNGVDLSVFRPASQQEARARLGIPQAAKVLLFAAKDVRQNPWKDYETVRRAVAAAAEGLRGQPLRFIALGEGGSGERSGEVEVTFVRHLDDPSIVARYYQAADVYVHAAHADTFPNTVLEALACGTPVVATAVGGIPEQIDEAETGFLVPHGDAQAMAARLIALLADDSRRSRMGENAASVARQRFDLRRQADAYLDWYADLLSHRQAVPATGGRNAVPRASRPA